MIRFGVLHQLFRDLSIQLTDSKKFKDVRTNCGIYNKIKSGEPEISMGIDADFLTLINDDLHSAGMSFIVTKKEEKWIFTGEVGYSSYDLGFDERDSIEKSYDSIHVLLDHLEQLVLTLIEKYHLIINQSI